MRSQLSAASRTAQAVWFASFMLSKISPAIGQWDFGYRARISTGNVDSPLAYTTTSIPRSFNPRASSEMNNSVPPYCLGGTGIKGGAMRAIFICASKLDTDEKKVYQRQLAVGLLVIRWLG